MANKKVAATPNAKTGSYTIRVPKSARTGKFSSESKRVGRIQVGTNPKKAS